MKQLFLRFVREENGQDLVEYTLLLAFVCLASAALFIGAGKSMASIWTDTNIYNELGIPAIKIGPRGRRISARNEEIDVEEMLKAAQIYALMALDICNRARPI